MPGFGRSGPAEHWVAYGSSVDSPAGLSSLIGYPGQTPWKGGVAWPDPVAGLHAAAAVLVALHNRESLPDEGGATIEQAQFESMVSAIGHAVAQAQLEGNPVPQGNADDRFAIQGTWRCAGEDAWVSITAVDEEECARLAQLVEAEDLVPMSAKSLSGVVASWCAKRSPPEVTAACQASGIAAGEVHTSAEVHADAHFHHRGVFATVQQPSVGDFAIAKTPIHSSGAMVRVDLPAPKLGQHNTAVLREVGFSSAEIGELREAGVIADRPPR